MSIELTKLDGRKLILQAGPTYGYEELPQGTRLLMAGYHIDVVETIDEITVKWTEALVKAYDDALARMRDAWRSF